MISWLGSLGAVVQEFAMPVFAMLFASAVLASALCAAQVWRNRRGKGV